MNKIINRDIYGLNGYITKQKKEIFTNKDNSLKIEFINKALVNTD